MHEDDRRNVTNALQCRPLHRHQPTGRALVGYPSYRLRAESKDAADDGEPMAKSWDNQCTSAVPPGKIAHASVRLKGSRRSRKRPAAGSSKRKSKLVQLIASHIG